MSCQCRPHYFIRRPPALNHADLDCHKPHTHTHNEERAKKCKSGITSVTYGGPASRITACVNHCIALKNTESPRQFPSTASHTSSSQRRIPPSAHRSISPSIVVPREKERGRKREEKKAIQPLFDINYSDCPILPGPHRSPTPRSQLRSTGATPSSHAR